MLFHLTCAHRSRLAGTRTMNESSANNKQQVKQPGVSTGLETGKEMWHLLSLLLGSYLLLLSRGIYMFIINVNDYRMLQCQ